MTNMLLRELSINKNWISGFVSLTNELDQVNSQIRMDFVSLLVWDYRHLLFKKKTYILILRTTLILYTIRIEFFHEITSSRPSEPKRMFMQVYKACKRNSRMKLKKIILYMRKHGCIIKLKKVLAGMMWWYCV